MKQGYRWMVAAAAALLALGSGWLVGLGLVWLALDAVQRQQLGVVLPALAPLWLLAWGLGSAALGWAWWRGQQYRRQNQALARLAEQGRVLLSLHDAPPLPAQEGGTQAVAQVLQELVQQRDGLRRDMAEQVRLASGRVQQEKDHLAALLAELQQAVLVCNLEGRILLCNHLARQQWGAATGVGGPGGAVGIGRSVYGLLDRALLLHALQGMRQRLARGAAHAGWQFVTHTQDGQLLRVQMTPVLSGQPGPGQAAAPPPVLSGFVLLLEDVTHSVVQEQARDSVLHSVTEGNRASLATIRAALAMLEPGQAAPAADPRFVGVVQAELARMGERIDELAQRAAEGVRARWPLEEMLSQEFIAAAQHHLQGHVSCTIGVDAVQEGLWLQVDSYSLLQVLAYLGERLVDEFAVRSLRLRLQAAENGHVHLDLVWTGHAMSTETVMSWEMVPMHVGAEHSILTVREVVARHGGSMWFERELASHSAFFRLLLPLGSAREGGTPPACTPLPQRMTSRPEFYDFDLFQHTEPDSAWDDRPLSSLRYTVFDTETTGLNPSRGDQIIQIGAVRIVNGRLLAHESFEQLVHPGRDIPAAGIPIHGITPEMVADQPRIEAVLPVFHRFAADSVLVAHNAAFDMKFLQLLERRTGIVFDQPVLDTLLLSAVAHPHQDSHRLEALAERFGVAIFGRHTALGDAMVTAEVWLHLLGQLEKMGIRTLRQAREAAQKSYYARLKY